MQHLNDLSSPARAVAVVAIRRDLAALDLDRAVARTPLSEADNHALKRWVHRTRHFGSGPDSMPLDGFSGSTPYEICERFAAGLIDESQVLDELVRYPYVPGGSTDGYDSLIADHPGTWSEVASATRHGLIDQRAYEAVFSRRHPSYVPEVPEVSLEEPS